MKFQNTKLCKWLCKAFPYIEALVFKYTRKRKQSKGEAIVENWLKENKLKYKTEHLLLFSFNIRKKPYVFIDFYLPKKKIFIEYNGRQHYEFVPKFHKTKEDFNNQLFRDMVVRKYCEYKKIKLIELPWYLTEDSIKTILSKEMYG